MLLTEGDYHPCPTASPPGRPAIIPPMKIRTLPTQPLLAVTAPPPAPPAASPLPPPSLPAIIPPMTIRPLAPQLLLAVTALSAVPSAAVPVPTIRPAGIQFFALSVPDAAASARWYQDVFGMTVLREIKPPDAPVHIFILTSDRLEVEILQHPQARPFTQAAPGVKAPTEIHGIF